MRKIREILRLLWSLEFGIRKTARACLIPHSTVLEYQRRAKEAGLSWEEVGEMDDEALDRRLFPPEPSSSRRPLPVWKEIRQELKRRGVTLQLLCFSAIEN